MDDSNYLCQTHCGVRIADHVGGDGTILGTDCARKLPDLSLCTFCG